MEQKIKIGVMGSAQGPTLQKGDTALRVQELGKWIAKMDCVLITGACPGLPNEAAIGAKKNDGFVIGISPAFSEYEHKKIYRSPSADYDAIMYTGAGLMERDITNIRSSDAIIIVGGGVGTLNEFTIAYDEGKVVGILKGSGGISDNIPEILKMCNRPMENRIITASDPKKLVERVIIGIKELGQPKIEDERVITGKGN